MKYNLQLCDDYDNIIKEWSVSVNNNWLKEYDMETAEFDLSKEADLEKLSLEIKEECKEEDIRDAERSFQRALCEY